MRPAKRLRAAAGLLVMTVGAAMGPLAAVRPAAAADTQAAASVPLVLSTYNVKADLSPATFAKAVSAMMPRADILGLQEVKDSVSERVQQLDVNIEGCQMNEDKLRAKRNKNSAAVRSQEQKLTV